MRKKGYTLKEMVLAINICLIMLPILLISMIKLNDLKYYYDDISGNISIMQLRKILLISYDIEVSNDNLHFSYQNKECDLYLTNNHLIMSPGTQVIYENIDDVRFYINNSSIYLEIERDNKYETFCLAKTESFSIDAFSSCNDGDDKLYDDVSESY